MAKETDARLMMRAIALGHTALGKAWPNPAVGCIVAHGDEIVGQGATGKGGRPHAEEVALAQAGGRAGGAAVYVTLEPCAVRTSGAASCSELLVQSRVARVVVAHPDPTPNADGGGIRRLRSAGIEVAMGVCMGAAAVLSAGFAHLVSTGLPLVEASDDGEEFDARFEPRPGESDEAALRRYGEAGYTRLWTPAPRLART